MAFQIHLSLSRALWLFTCLDGNEPFMTHSRNAQVDVVTLLCDPIETTEYSRCNQDLPRSLWLYLCLARDDAVCSLDDYQRLSTLLALSIWIWYWPFKVSRMVLSFLFLTFLRLRNDGCPYWNQGATAMRLVRLNRKMPLCLLNLSSSHRQAFDRCCSLGLTSHCWGSCWVSWALHAHCYLE